MIMFAGVMFLFGLFGLMVVDVGLLVNERRDAQNDVDKAALAGVQELTLTLSTVAADSALATTTAEDWAEANGIDLSDPDITLTVNIVSTCFSANDPVPTGVQVTVQRPAPTMLVGLLGITNWDATATATACTGRAQTLTGGFLPWAVSEVDTSCFAEGGSDYTPEYGGICDMVIDTNANGLHGELGLSRATGAECDEGNGSASVLEQNIIYGAESTCSSDANALPADGYVKGNPGHNVGKAKSAVEERLSTEGVGADSCGVKYGYLGGDPQVDEFVEVYVEVDGFYQRRDCESPRAIIVIVVHDWQNPENGSGNKTYRVQGFVEMYLYSCITKNDVEVRDCDWNGGGKFTVRGQMVDTVIDPTADAGIDVGYGQQLYFLAI